jgi:hypothetical protein
MRVDAGTGLILYGEAAELGMQRWKSKVCRGGGVRYAEVANQVCRGGRIRYAEAAE